LRFFPEEVAFNGMCSGMDWHLNGVVVIGRRLLDAVVSVRKVS
jgi:small basic protein